MHEHSPWITLFERESHYANNARFQVALAHSGEVDDFLVTLMAFSLEASATFSQLLLFKFQESEATLKHYSGSVSINDKLLIEISPEIKNKVAAFTSGYVKSLPDLD